MANKLSEVNKSKFYDFIVQYEKVISTGFGRYNIKNKSLITFCEENRILIGSDCRSNSNKISRYKYYILWDDRKPDKFKSKCNDSAHNLLRHLRNAMAHGNIKSENRQKFVLSDFNENQRITMRGDISNNLLFSLISCVTQTFQ